MKKNTITKQIECQCEWKARPGNAVDFPAEGWVSIETIKEKYPLLLIAFYEMETKMYGEIEQAYPLYWGLGKFKDTN